MKWLSTILIVLLPGLLLAQIGNPHMGARSAAMGHASVTNIDVWAVHHNQAALGFLEKSAVAVSYESRFLTNNLSQKGAVGAIKLKKFGTISLNVSQFGYSQYNDNKFGLGYAMKLAEEISIGAQVNYQYIAFGANDYDGLNVLTTEVGVLAKLTDKISLGAHIFNLNYAKVSDYDNEHIPMIIRLGAGFQFSKEFVGNAEVEKSLEQDANIKLGAEYTFFEKLAVRGGINTQPFSNSFGLGYKISGLSIDVAANYHSVLGYSPQASLQYRF
jgi:hypothetical protein